MRVAEMGMMRWMSGHIRRDKNMNREEMYGCPCEDLRELDILILMLLGQKTEADPLTFYFNVRLCVGFFKYPIELLIGFAAIARTVGHLSKSAEVMKLVNNLMKAPEVAITMQEFSKEMTKAGVMEEMVNDAVDSALDSEDMEEEIEEEVDKVLTTIAGETTAQLPQAVRKEKLKQPAQAVEDAEEDEEDLEELRARLAKVRS
ncbi:Vacuolar protein sorting-associated protein 24 -like protein 1 [Capsicum chinense]|nr:Vacuolar protein sorting-associated protein 24 -like protein 1 [Capsicum chinense]